MMLYDSKEIFVSVVDARVCEVLHLFMLLNCLLLFSFGGFCLYLKEKGFDPRIMPLYFRFCFF